MTRKKLQTLLTLLLLFVGVTSAWAERDITKPVYSPTNDGSYDDIRSAIDDIKNNSATTLEIQLWGDCSIKASGSVANYRIDCPEGKTLNIIPKANVTVTRGTHNRGEIWFLVNKASSTFNIGSSGNYTITISSDGSSTKIINAVTKREKGNMTLTKVTFNNMCFDVDNTKEGYIYTDKSDAGAKVIFTDITVSSCTTTQDAFIYSQSTTDNNIVLNGAISFSSCTGKEIKTSKKISILGSVEDGYKAFTASNPLRINWTGSTDNGTTVVEGVAEDETWNELFSLASTTKALTRNSANLQVADATVLNTTQGTGFASLNDAVKQINKDDVLQLKSDITLSSDLSTSTGDKGFTLQAGTNATDVTLANGVTLTVNKSRITLDGITIKVASNGSATITRGTDGSTGQKGIIFVVGSGKSATINGSGGTLTLQDQSNATGSFVEAGGGATIIIKGVTIKNSAIGNGAPLQRKSGTGGLTVEDVVFENISADLGAIWSRSDVTLKGTITFKNHGEGKPYLSVANASTFTLTDFTGYSNGTSAITSIPVRITGDNNNDKLNEITRADGTALIIGGIDADYNITNNKWYTYVSGSDIYASTSYTLTVTAAGMSTLVLPFNATIPTQNTDEESKTVSAYKLTTASSVVSAGSVASIAAGEPVLIVADAGSYKFEAADAAITYSRDDTPKSGAMIGAYKQINAADGNYVLQNGSDGVGFYKLVSTSNHVINPFRAYLSGEANAQGAREFIGINFGGETTGIANLNVNDNFDANAPMYNLAGQRVGANYKGVVIQNGKKYIKK